MSKKFSELVAATMTPDSIGRARDRAQEALECSLAVKQPSVAELERSADVYVSSLRTQIEAMGGKLEIIARFPTGDSGDDRLGKSTS